MLQQLKSRLGRLGFGGAGIGNLYRPIDDTTAHATLQTAVAAGVRYFDTAPHYGFGLSEKRLGMALRMLDPKNEVVVSTKVGRRLVAAGNVDLGTARQGFVSPEPFESTFDYSYDGVMRSFEGSLERLGRPIDILFVHDIGQRVHGAEHPASFRQLLEGGYRALRELRDARTVHAIGLGVNEWEICEQALQHCDLDVVLLAGRYTLLEQDALESFLPLCETRGVAVIVGAPYNSGILVNGSRAAGAHYDYGAVPPQVLTSVAAIEEVCARYHVPLASAALQFPVAHPQVVAVIPGMSTPVEVAEAAEWLAHPIPSALWSELRDRNLIRTDAPLPRAA